MKKYNIFHLYVIKVSHNNDEDYFICRPSEFGNYYLEIFSNKKISVSSQSLIEPLGKYYPLFSSQNFLTKESLQLSKEELYHKYVEINQLKQALKKEQLIFDNSNYKMKNKYEAKTLVIAQLKKAIGGISQNSFGSIRTKQKYLFERINIYDETYYQEVFTGFKAQEEASKFNVPFVIHVKDLVELWPEMSDQELSKIDLLWILNDLNFPRTQQFLQDETEITRAKL